MFIVTVGPMWEALVVLAGLRDIGLLGPEGGKLWIICTRVFFLPIGIQHIKYPWKLSILDRYNLSAGAIYTRQR